MEELELCPDGESVVVGRELLFLRGWLALAETDTLLDEQKDTAWADSIKQSIAAASVVGTMEEDQEDVLAFPATTPFAPDAVLSLTDVAAVYDSASLSIPLP